MDSTRQIPDRGIAKAELLEELDSMSATDGDWKSGKVWSLVYHIDDEHHRFLEEAFGKYFSTNFLNPVVFKSLKRMETEVVRMTAEMLHGDDEVVGTMTSGGTESIIMAVYAYRERARKRRPWIRRPNIVCPNTVHPAFRKAAHYFDIKLREVAVGDDHRAVPKALARKINHNTIALAASAPQYAQGVVDPIAEIGALAERRKLPFHVDSCIGGFMLPWVEDLGYPVPEFDFRVPGVTSISADVHKYGYAAKGASVVVYRNMDYLKHQFFVSTHWTGGIYVSPTMPGTKPGGTIAAAWAAMQAIGKEGYRDLAAASMKATKEFIAGINAIDGLEVVGQPHMTLVSYRSNDPAVDIFAVGDQLEERGWAVDRQQKPNSIHVTVTKNHVDVIATYIADVNAAVSFVRDNPGLESQGNAAMYGMMAKIPTAFQGMVKYSVQKIMEGMYSASGEMPDLSKMAAEDPDPVMKMVNRYGPAASKALDQVTAVSDRLRKYLPR